MSGPSSVSDDCLISHDRAEDAIFRALALFMGRGRPHAVADVGLALRERGHQISDRALHSYIAADPGERKMPPADILLVLQQYFGSRFASKVLSAIGQAAREMAPLPADPAKVIMVLGTGFTQFAIRGADGIYCHQDDGALEPIADEMIQVLEPFSSRRAG